MMSLLGVRPEERTRVALLLVHYVWVVAVTIAGKSVRDTYFLTRYDRSVLPLMAVAAAIAVAVAVALFTRVGRRLSSNVLVPAGCVVFAATLALLHFRLEGPAIPVLYVWMEVINVITVLQFWLLAAELIDPRQAKRLFPIIGGGGSLAAILIGPQLKPFSKAYGSDTLLWLVCSLLVGAALFAIVTTRLPRVPQVHQKPATGPRQRRRYPPYLRMVSLLVVCCAVVSAIVDYQFKIISSETLRTETDLVGFFGQFYAGTGASTLLLQFVVASYAFRRFGVVLVMAVLPFMLGLGSVSVLIWPVLWSAVLSRFSDQTFRFTLHNGGLELLWLPVSPELRKATKPFINGSLKSITEGVVGIAIYLLLKVLTAAQLSFVSILFCAGWIASLIRLRSLYVSELQSAIATRRLPPEDLAVSTTDALTVKAIDRALSKGDTAQTLFVLGLLANLPRAPWRETLQRLLESGVPEVKARILEIAAADKTIVGDDMLAQMAKGSGADAIEAIRAIAATGTVPLRQVVETRLDDQDPGLRAAACAALIRLDGSGDTEARRRLQKMLSSPQIPDRAAALEEAAKTHLALDSETIETALKDPARQVRAKALECAAIHPDNRHASLIASALSDPVLFSSARSALAALPPDVVLPVLAHQIDTTNPGELRLASLRAMKICLDPATHAVLITEVDARWPILANQASESLFTVVRQVPPSTDSTSHAIDRRSHLVHDVSTLNKVRQEIPNAAEAVLVKDYLQSSVSELLAAVMRLAAFQRPESPVESCIQILHSNDRARLPYVLELLDALLTPSERQLLSPLLDSVGRKDSGGNGKLPEDSSSPAYVWIKESIYSEAEWLRAIGLDYVLTRSSQQPGDIDWSRIPATPLISEVVAGCIRKNPEVAGRVPETHIRRTNGAKSSMLTTLEKTILLKSVPLFTDIPGAELSRVAQIAEDTAFPAETMIFREGDHGDCLYIIVSGSVSIQKRGVEIAVLTQGQSLGEMAVLDSSPRSADALTKEDTVMLRVGQEQFLEIMQANAQVMRGVVRMLLTRLRDAGDKLATKTEAVPGR